MPNPTCSVIRVTFNWRLVQELGICEFVMDARVICTQWLSKLTVRRTFMLYKWNSLGFHHQNVVLSLVLTSAVPFWSDSQKFIYYRTYLRRYHNIIELARLPGNCVVTYYRSLDTTNCNRAWSETTLTFGYCQCVVHTERIPLYRYPYFIGNSDTKWILSVETFTNPSPLVIW